MSNVLEKFSNSGLLIRMFGDHSLKFETETQAAERTSCATLIHQKLPINVYHSKNKNNIGLLFDPDRIRVKGTFKKNIGSDAAGGARDKESVPYIINAKGKETLNGFTNYKTIDALREKLFRMAKKNEYRLMAHNEVFITVPPELQDMKSRIIGVVIFEERLCHFHKIIPILVELEKCLPGRNIYIYHAELGELTEIPIDLVIAVLYRVRLDILEEKKAQLLQLRAKL